MGFDSKAFMKASFEPRTAKVPVPALKQFFDDDEDPVWEVRGMTGVEVARINEVGDKSQKMAAMVEAFAAASKSDIAEQLKQNFGIGPDTPTDFNKRVDQVVCASISPVVSQDQVVRLATVAPIEFYAISNKILELTGKGQTAEVKRKPSGKTKESE